MLCYGGLVDRPLYMPVSIGLSQPGGHSLSMCQGQPPVANLHRLGVGQAVTHLKFLRWHVAGQSGCARFPRGQSPAGLFSPVRSGF